MNHFKKPIENFVYKLLFIELWMVKQLKKSVNIIDIFWCHLPFLWKHYKHKLDI